MEGVVKRMEGLKCACGQPAETVCETGNCAPSTLYCRTCYEKEHLDDWIPGESEPNAHHRDTTDNCPTCGGPLCSCGWCHDTRTGCTDFSSQCLNDC